MPKDTTGKKDGPAATKPYRIGDTTYNLAKVPKQRGDWWLTEQDMFDRVRSFIMCRDPKTTHASTPVQCTPFWKSLLQHPSLALVNPKEDDPDYLRRTEPWTPEDPAEPCLRGAPEDELCYEGAGGLPPDLESETLMKLREGANSTVWLQRGTSESSQGVFVCKSYPTSSPQSYTAALNELALYDSPHHLKPLQGFVVPRLRGAYTAPGTLALAFDAPSSRMWTEAGAGMPRRARARCVWALEQLHARGVLHGDVQRHHFLLAPDWRVCIVDFSKARVRDRRGDMRLALAQPEEFAAEVRRLEELLSLADVYEPPEGVVPVEDAPTEEPEPSTPVAGPSTAPSVQSPPESSPSVQSPQEPSSPPAAPDAAPPELPPRRSKFASLPMRVIVPGQSSARARATLSEMLTPFHVPPLQPHWYAAPPPGARQSRDAARRQFYRGGPGRWQKLRAFAHDWPGGQDTLEHTRARYREHAAAVRAAADAVSVARQERGAEARERLAAARAALGDARCERDAFVKQRRRAMYPLSLFPELYNRSSEGPPIITAMESDFHHRLYPNVAPEAAPPEYPENDDDPPLKVRPHHDTRTAVPAKSILKGGGRPSEDEVQRTQELLAEADLYRDRFTDQEDAQEKAKASKIRTFVDMGSYILEAPYPYGAQSLYGNGRKS